MEHVTVRAMYQTVPASVVVMLWWMNVVNVVATDLKSVGMEAVPVICLIARTKAALHTMFIVMANSLSADWEMRAM